MGLFILAGLPSSPNTSQVTDILSECNSCAIESCGDPTQELPANDLGMSFPVNTVKGETQYQALHGLELREDSASMLRNCLAPPVSLPKSLLCLLCVIGCRECDSRHPAAVQKPFGFVVSPSAGNNYGFYWGEKYPATSNFISLYTVES